MRRDNQGLDRKRQSEQEYNEASGQAQQSDAEGWNELDINSAEFVDKPDESRESVLDAIREGDWTFEPEEVEETIFDDTEAMPGSREKIDIMAERVRQGLPIWHSADRRTYGDAD